MKAGNTQGGKVISEDGLKNWDWKTPGATSGQALSKTAGRILLGLEVDLALAKVVKVIVEESQGTAPMQGQGWYGSMGSTRSPLASEEELCDKWEHSNWATVFT